METAAPKVFLTASYCCLGNVVLLEDGVVFDGSFLADALYLHVLVLTCLLLVNTATNVNIVQTLQTDFCSSQLDHIRSNDGLRFWNGGGQVLPRIRQTRHETHVNTDEVR